MNKFENKLTEEDIFVESQSSNTSIVNVSHHIAIAYAIYFLSIADCN